MPAASSGMTSPDCAVKPDGGGAAAGLAIWDLQFQIASCDMVGEQNSDSGTTWVIQEATGWRTAGDACPPPSSTDSVEDWQLFA